jgi:DNA-binding transcriptional ArsR family regulator
VFSSRQISAIISNRVSHTTVSSIIGKKDKTGGNLNVASLEVLRNILYSRSSGETNYGLIAKALEEGTSQGMISKLTGVSQSSISRRFNG